MVLFLIGSMVVLVVASRGAPTSADRPDVQSLLTAATTAAAFILGMILWVQSRYEHPAGGLPLALGTLVIALVGVGLGELAPLVAGSATRLDIARSWGLLLGLALHALARLPRRRTLPFLVAALPVALAAASSLVHWMTPAAVYLALGALALAHGLAFLETGLGRHAWLAVGLAGLLLGEMGQTMLAPPGGAWVASAQLIRLAGLMFAITGIISELQRSYTRKLRQLEVSQGRLDALSALNTASERLLEERDHEARSALTSIEYAAHALRHAQKLNSASITELELALDTEIALLRRLVTLPSVEVDLSKFSLADTLAGVVLAQRAAGLAVEFDMPPMIEVIGIPAATAEIVQALIENAGKHAPGSDIEVTARDLGEWVFVHVDDGGPGVPPAQRQVIFRRGRDSGLPSSAQGRGLGLYVAENLARTQSGHLWVEDSHRGGASFRLALRSASPGIARERPGRRTSPVSEPARLDQRRA